MDRYGRRLLCIVDKWVTNALHCRQHFYRFLICIPPEPPLARPYTENLRLRAIQGFCRDAAWFSYRQKQVRQRNLKWLSVKSFKSAVRMSKIVFSLANFQVASQHINLKGSFNFMGKGQRFVAPSKEMNSPSSPSLHFWVWFRT